MSSSFAPPVSALPSPCVGVCTMTEDGALCQACARTREEIAAWSTWSTADKLAAFRRLPQRRQDLGLGIPVLGHPLSALDRRIGEALANPASLWTLGVPGAVAVVALDHGAAGVVDDDTGQASPGRLRAQAVGQGGGLRLDLDHQSMKIKPIGSAAGTEGALRGWESGPLPVAEDGLARRIDLCLYRAKAEMAGRTRLTALGPDTAALRPSDRSGLLFDLGLGVPHLDVCLRVAPEQDALLRRLKAAEGAALPTDDPDLWEALRAAAPARVFESRLARLEVWAPPPTPDAPSPVGSRTHLLPEVLAEGRLREPEAALPDTLVSALTLYPARPLPLVAEDETAAEGRYTALR